MSDLRFDPKRHDAVVSDLRSQEAKQKATALLAKVYQDWKRQLQRKIKKKEIKTAQDLIAATYDLQSLVGKAIGHTSEMQDFRKFCFDLLEDKISEIILTAGWAKNLFTEFIPQEQSTTDSFIIPQRFPFESWAEFAGHPFLKAFSDKDGFIGFVRDSKAILAWFRDGECVRVGIVANAVGVKQMPTLQEVQKELLKLPKPPASKPPNPSSPGA